MKRNGQRLASIPATELVQLTSEQLAEGTDVSKQRQLQKLGGWQPLCGNAHVLSANSSWHNADIKRLVLVLRDANSCQVFKRPANPLQLAIDKAKRETCATLPIGQAVVVRHKDVCLIAAPTMETPGRIPPGSRVVYDAARAAFVAWTEHKEIGTIRMPAFGTGWGQVPIKIAAAQMWEAFVDAWNSC